MRYEFPDNILPGRIGLPAWSQEAQLSLLPPATAGAGLPLFFNIAKLPELLSKA